MPAFQALRRLFGSNTTTEPREPSALDALLAPGTVAIISAACCDAMSSPRDEELAAHLAAALERSGARRSVVLNTLTATRQHLRDHPSPLPPAVLALRDQLGAVFQAEGLSAFPLLVIDGKLAFYGGVPGVDELAHKLGEGPR